MAFTKIAAAGIGSTGTVTLENVVVTGGITASLTGTATSTTNIPNLTGAITSVNTTTSLGSFSSANLSAALTDETGSGAAVFATGPVLVTPSLGIATASSLVVSGITTVSAGSTSAPSITPSGDSNTGIFFPSADTIAASTGGTSRITIDSSGNITVTNNLIIPLGTSLLPSLAFLSDPNTGIYSPGADQLAVATNGQGRLFVDSSGRVGLGVVSPGYPVDLVSQSGESIRIRGTSGTEISKLLFTSNSAGADYGWLSSASSYLAFGTAATERMRLTSTGLGIGTSSPNYELHVNASDATNVIQLTNSGTGTGASDGFLLYNNGVNATVSNQEAGYLSLETSGQARLHILSDGKVGIGTASVYAQLEISGNSGGRGLRLSEPSGEVLDISAGAAANDPARIATSSGSGIAFAVNGTAGEHARIDSSGRLLIGTFSSQCAVSTLKSVDTNNIGHFQTFAFYKGGLGQNPTNTNVIAITLPNTIGISVTIMLNVRLIAYQNTDQGGERSATYCINLLRISANGGSASNAIQANVSQIGSDIATSVGSYSVGSLTVSVDAGSSSTGSVTAYIRVSGTSTSGASDTRVYMSGYSMGSPSNQPTIAAA